MKLTRTDRQLFRTVAELLKANPFSDERLALDVQVADVRDVAKPLAVLAVAVERLAKRLDTLRREGLDSIARLTGEDRDLLESAVLFVRFHQAIEAFDSFIRETAAGARGDRRAAFLVKLHADLMGWGIAPDTAVRYVGRFYQVRRAYRFIFDAAFGQTPSVQAFRQALWSNIFTHDIRLYDRYLWNRMEDFSTLLLGETGTGKGSAAMAIGRSGFIPYDPDGGHFTGSFADAFTSINLSQFSEALIESELFGHRKGAFTGAIEHHTGALSRCRPYGTIFLDEIGDVTEPVQIKLLQVLQERTYRPVGSHTTERFEGRVVAATHRSIAELREAGRFRHDFYYRLCSDIITVPPLRVRIGEAPEELGALVVRILERMGGTVLVELAPMVTQALEERPGVDYAWPGNVRELEQAIRRILLHGRYDGDLTLRAASSEDAMTRGLRDGQLSAQELLQAYARHCFARFGTYGAVAERLGLDWRTVKKYVTD